MKKKEVLQLLNLFDQKDQEELDFSGFSEPGIARDHINRLRAIRAEYTNHETGFSPFFTDSVMGRITSISSVPGIQDYLSMLFTRVVTYGLTAVVVVIVTLYFLHGQEVFSNFLGTDGSNDVNFISSLFYEF